ncbi:ladderlectin-like [Poeciliopsis prolifica]|uniref:ladderlectin-like n=1 Tax=Poeciliopsis prolifica TaxID=188132 RepID=UPI002413EAA4|nr:ladderlectin-like [Poeciliopsis prolifica]
MAAGLLFSLLLGLSFGLWDGADAGCRLKVADCEECTHGWRWYEGRCFLYVKVKMTWGDAERFCLSLDANLASINTLHEYHFIRDFTLNSTGKHKQTWVGGHDSAQEDTWFWSDGSKFVFHRWGYREPNNFGGNEKCMDINMHGRDHVNDNECSKKFPFICAKSP